MNPLHWILLGLVVVPSVIAYERWRSGTFWKRYDDALDPTKNPAAKSMPRPLALAYLAVTLVLIFGWDSIAALLLDSVKHR